METSSASKELEAVLIVRENQETVVKKIAGLRSILGYTLRPKPDRTIRDRYFDTADSFLRKRRANLRIREIDGTVFVSAKSDPRVFRGAILRKERELPWSGSALARIGGELKLQAPAKQFSLQSSSNDPVESLSAMGLKVIQERRTRREARDVVSRSEPADLVVAELAIDHVTYHFDNHNVPISEVEVEAKAENTSSAIKDITETLLSTFEPSLQKWNHGKFVTGEAIELLLRAGTLQKYLDDNGLKPTGLDTIDKLIRSQRFSYVPKFWRRARKIS